MSEAFAGGTGGKKTASGTFTGGGTTSKTIPLDFTPSKVSCLFQSAVTPSVSNEIKSICFDFETGYGWLAYYSGAFIIINLGNSGNSAFRPTYSNGVLTFTGGGNSNFSSGSPYEWFAAE